MDVAEPARTENVQSSACQAVQDLMLAGFGDPQIFLTHVFPMDDQQGGKLRPKIDEPKLYNALLQSHAAACFECGGEVTLLFGYEAQHSIKQDIAKKNVVSIVRPGTPYIHRRNGSFPTPVDVEIWLYKGFSMLQTQLISGACEIERRLVITAPLPSATTAECFSVEGKIEKAQRLDAAVEFFFEMIGLRKTDPLQFLDLARRRQPDRGVKKKQNYRV
jgi:hypothetical protein